MENVALKKEWNRMIGTGSKILHLRRGRLLIFSDARLRSVEEAYDQRASLTLCRMFFFIVRQWDNLRCDGERNFSPDAVFNGKVMLSIKSASCQGGA